MAKIIGLDCGHGLRTSGKQTPDGIKEWTLNDKVRDKVVALLKGYDVKFVFTDYDEGNTDEALGDRVRHYINADVDVFVSIHHNAFTGKWNNATGVEVYVDKNPTAKDNALANAIYKRLPGYTGLKGRGIKKENWYVINQNKIPAVLVEGGFMDSNNDYKVITSDKGQEAYARAVAEGLIEFLGLVKNANTQATKPVAEKPDAAQSFNKSKAGTYRTTANLHLRVGASTSKKSICVMPKNSLVTNYGYYTGVWYLVKYGDKTGFCSSNYLKRK